jgi:hypothetical protein
MGMARLRQPVQELRGLTREQAGLHRSLAVNEVEQEVHFGDQRY